MTRRHWAYAAIGVLLLLGNLYAFWPFVEAKREMAACCDGLPVGTTLDQVRSLAVAQGDAVVTEPNGRVVVEDPRSLGRFSCALAFGIPSHTAPISAPPAVPTLPATAASGPASS
jgi:hypothetical protein